MTSVVRIVLFLAFAMHVSAGRTDVEDKLETEIEYKSPRFYQKDWSHAIQCTRQAKFGQMAFNRSGTIQRAKVNSIDLFQRYRYQNRDKDALCPVHPQGIATQVDWAFMQPCLFAEDPSVSPRTIFVFTPMLTHFAETTLKNMDPNFRFVLLSGGTDATIPRSFYWDRTFRGFSEDMNSLWGVLLKDPRIIHWFAENHDLNHPKISTLPTGLVFTQDGERFSNPYADHPPRSNVTAITQRPLKFVVSDKVRNGMDIWADRQYAVDHCAKLPNVCFNPTEGTRDNGVSHYEFVRLLTSYPFIACVHGAGLEPSPKAWEAIMLGTIPIIQHSTLDDAYERLPVVFVHEWKDLFEHSDIEGLLRIWLTKLAPFYEENSVLRNGTLDRLNMDYWLYQAHHKYEHYLETELNAAHHDMHNGTSHHNSTVHVHNWSGAQIKRSLRGSMKNERLHGLKKGDSSLPNRVAIEWNEI